MKTYSFLNPEGKVVETRNLSKFCRKHNLKLRRMQELVAGHALTHKGYISLRPEAKKKRKLLRTYVYNIHTQQVERVGTSITEFSRKFELYSSILSKVLRGKSLCYNGWMLLKSKDLLDKYA